MAKIFLKEERGGVTFEITLDTDELHIPDNSLMHQIIRETLQPYVQMLVRSYAGFLLAGPLFPILVDDSMEKLAESSQFAINMMQKVQSGEIDPAQELLRYLARKAAGSVGGDAFTGFLDGLDTDDL